jgi:dTDP-4-amino-4,6-dideoxygalactose transaminase
MTTVPIVPFANLALLHDRVEDAVRAGIDRVLRDSDFVLGTEVARFERRFAAYCGVTHSIGVGNGTDAVELALRGAGIGPGDEVIVPTNTFVASAEGVIRAGATPVFADCDDDYLIDVDDAVRAAGPRTRAVLAVHLYGQCAPVERLREALPDLLVIEDAAQAQGARRHGVRAGALGDVAATSFYPGKNLGAYGDAGAVLTGDDAVAERIRGLRNHGGIARYEHRILGSNSRLDGIQAAVLNVKLGELDAWNEERRAAARRYDELLDGLDGVTVPRELPGNEHVFHLYVVRMPERDRVEAELSAAGVATGLHYPIPIHRLAPFRDPGARALPVAERQAGEILSLPIFPGITARQQEYVAAALHAAVRTAVRR